MRNAVNLILMLHAKGRKIVGQQLPTSLNVASVSTPCYMLRVVGSCCAKFETGQTLSYVVQTDATTPNNVASVALISLILVTS